MKLIHKSTGKVVREGDTVTNFRGEKGIVLGWTKPHSPQSTGRIFVYVQGTEHYCCPEVYSCEWINREDRLEELWPMPVGGFGDLSSLEQPISPEENSLSSVSSFDRTAQLMAEVEDELNRIQETLNEIKRLLS